MDTFFFAIEKNGCGSTPYSGNERCEEGRQKEKKRIVILSSGTVVVIVPAFLHITSYKVRRQAIRFLHVPLVFFYL